MLFITGELWKKTGGQNASQTDWPCSKYKWRHSNDVIVIKLTAGSKNKIPYKTYFEFLRVLKILKKWRRFVTYLWNAV